MKVRLLEELKVAVSDCRQHGRVHPLTFHGAPDITSTTNHKENTIHLYRKQRNMREP